MIRSRSAMKANAAISMLLVTAACQDHHRSPEPGTPKVKAFRADVEWLEPGGGTRLVAEFSGGTATIEPGVGEVRSGVPVAVHPRVTTTYTLKVVREGAPAATAMVTIRTPPAIDLEIRGLNQPVHAVTVTGPGGFSRSLDRSTLIKDLAPGTYTIRADPAPGPGGVRRPLRPEQTIEVSGGTAVAVEFAAPALTVTLPGGIPLEFVQIPAGSFTMGSDSDDRINVGELDPRPPHTVTFAKPFLMARLPTTVAQWQALLPGDGHPAASDQAKRDVSYDDIKSSFLPALHGKVPGYEFRLPSEAEWEYAARAGSTTRYFFGPRTPDEDEVFGRYAWRDGRLDHPVGEKWANPWGLFDLFGNGLQWCEDHAVNGYAGAPADGSARVHPSKNVRILRGSAPSAADVPRFTFTRVKGEPSFRAPSLIFRIVAVPK